MTTDQLEKAIKRYFDAGPAATDAMATFLDLRGAIESEIHDRRLCA